MRIKGGQDSDKEDDYNEDEVEDEDIEQDNSYQSLINNNLK